MNVPRSWQSEPARVAHVISPSVIMALNLINPTSLMVHLAFLILLL